MASDQHPAGQIGEWEAIVEIFADYQVQIPVSAASIWPKKCATDFAPSMVLLKAQVP